MPRSNANKPKTRTRVLHVAFVGSLLTLLMAPAASAEEPIRCGTVWYEWVGETAVVQDYTEDPGLSITIVGRYVWAQNTAEPASSTQHTKSVELTTESPNPYTICIGDTTDPSPRESVTVEQATVDQANVEQAEATATRQAVAQPAMQLVQVSDVLDALGSPLTSGLRLEMCERQLEALLCAL